MESVIRPPDPKVLPDIGDLSPLLGAYEGITLGEIRDSDAQLQSRREKKFLMTFEQCVNLISGLNGSYRALDIEHSRIGRYDTMYYDTGSFMTYLQHHNGKANRFKLRFRYYCSTGKTFLEVKERLNTGRTVKTRLETEGTISLTDKGPAGFLESAFPYDFREFYPVLSTEYNRITLVSKDFGERVTFDLGLSFRNNTTLHSYPGVVVGEIKHDRPLFMSQALAGLKMMGIRKTRFSKYCIGVALLYPEQKHNAFKPVRIHLETLSHGGVTAC